MPRHASTRNAPAIFARRRAGTLLHVSSLPAPHGVGDLGPTAHAFADWCAAAGQTIWQMLPVGPVGPGDSPYASTSSFAGEPLYISLELLADDGLLPRSALRVQRGDPREMRIEHLDRARRACLQQRRDLARRPVAQIAGGRR